MLPEQAKRSYGDALRIDREIVLPPASIGNDQYRQCAGWLGSTGRSDSHAKTIAAAFHKAGDKRGESDTLGNLGNEVSRLTVPASKG